MKVDDDQCLSREKVQKDLKRLEKKEKGTEVYGGTHAWNGRYFTTYTLLSTWVLSCQSTS